MLKTISNYLENRRVNKRIDYIALVLTSLWYSLQYIDDETSEVCFFNAVGQPLILSFDKILDIDYINSLVAIIEDDILQTLNQVGYDFIDYLDFKNNYFTLQIICFDRKNKLEVTLSIGQILGLKYFKN